MIVIVLSSILFFLSILVSLVLSCFLFGEGDTYSAKLKNTFTKILRWAGIESSSSSRKEKSSQSSPITRAESIATSNMDDLTRAFSELQKQVEQLNDKLKSTINRENDLLYEKINREIDVLKKELVVLKNETTSIKEFLLSTQQYTNDINNVANEASVGRSELSFPIVRYSKLVDCNSPLGFMDSNLVATSKGCCFCIEIVSIGEAKYRLVQDADMKREALLMFNPVISTACAFDEKPAIINDVINSEDGILRLSDGVWVIEKKNRVKLV